MSNNKQSSSIDFFWNQLPEILPFTVDTETAVKLWEVFEQAKAMHKEQCINYAHDFARQMLQNRRFVTPEIIYNETFGGNNEQQ